jgi:ribosomal protein S18 acetylase RimI-like enzyme
VSVSVAPIALEHAAGFHACLDTVARERRFLAQTQAPALEKVEGFVRDSVATDAIQFVALDGDTGRVVGWADVFAQWADAVKHDGGLGMGLLPAWRGQRIGERLLRACLDKARAKGLTRVHLHVRADNAAAIGLYERLGLRTECTMARAMRFDGVYYDALQMSLLLD